MAAQDSELEKISKRLQSIELRLSKLESALVLPHNDSSFQTEVPVPEHDKILYVELPEEEEKGIESQIGRFGLAWLGNIVLLFGITFLVQYLMNLGYHFLSAILGYVAAISIFFLSNYLKKANSHLAFMFKLNAQILLFYITLRLHFFSASPLIENHSISVIILILIVAFQTYISIINKSQPFALLAMLFALTAGVVADTTHVMLSMMTLTAAGATYFFYRFKWSPLLVVAILLTYITFFLWMFGNPVMGHPMQLVSEHKSGVIYLFGLGACYSFLLLLRKKDDSFDIFLTGMTFTNGMLFTFLLLLVVLRFFSTGYVALFSLITICCLIYSIVLYSQSDWNFASAFYALYGFMAMSISLYGLFGIPHVYLLFSVQSLIVVSMALWFRNRLIVIMNSFLFVTILLVYLLSSQSINGVNFSFAVVALISARIINWKRSRLHIETDLIRNLYMIIGFFMVLYSLYHSVPKQFVTLSWTLAALLYFGISLLLKNIKYRYMALGTMIFAAFYLFLVDLARIEIVYRILALLFLAAISIGISIYYTNRLKKSDR